MKILVLVIAATLIGCTPSLNPDGQITKTYHKLINTKHGKTMVVDIYSQQCPMIAAELAIIGDGRATVVVKCKLKEE